MIKNIWILFFAVVLLIQSTQAASNEELLQNCLKGGTERKCKLAMTHLPRPEALLAAERACELNVENCNQLYFIAIDISPEKGELYFKKAIKSCENNVQYCDDLADIYAVKKDYPAALKAARKYYDKFKKGSYTLLSYQYGTDKKPLFEDQLVACRADQEKCSFAVKNFPDHPQMAELLAATEAVCKKTGGTSGGFDPCTISGIHYYRNSNFQKAHEFWISECKTNQVPCLLIMGSDKFSGTQKNSALKLYCNFNGNIYSAMPEAPLRKNCAMVAPDRPIPPVISELAKEYVATAFDEKK